MSNKVLGRCACPLCGCVDQEVRESAAKSPKPYLNCEECGVQIFTRQAKSVRILKQRMEMVKPQEVDIAKPEPVAPKQKATQPSQEKAATQSVEVVAASSEPAERTIFDWFKPE